ncbi:hypothetical protein GQ53DRAFT_225338 [Thozetella sp. PMI_491]|nr:hypothetical protein GQ53DRAFT_225338 [Thozetella sp. PMI_491]
MDEVALDPGRGLLDQEEYHIDFDAPGINTDELDLGLEDLVEEQSGDVADPEVEDSLPVLEEIGYDEELQGDDNPDDTNPDDLALKPLGEEEEEEEEADTREEEIEYDDEDLPVDTADAISGENPDTDLIGPHDGGVTLDLTIDEVEHADYDHNNGEGFGYIDLQTADPDTQADELNDSFPGAVSTTDDGKYGDDEPSRLQEGDDYDTPGDEQSRADDIDDGDFDIAKKDEVSSSSYLPDVTVQYNRVRYSLFGGPQDHAEDYFLKDVGVLDRPLSQLFSSLRSIIMDEISPTDELLIRIDKLDGLEFREHSSSPFLNRTFREILDVYYRLLSNDGLGEDRLHISLVVVPGSEDVFARFLTAAEEGQGLSELAVSSEEASAIEQDDELAGNEEEDRAEDEDREEDVVLTEFTEQYTDRDEAAASRNNNEIEARGDPAPLDFIPDGEDFLESYPAESIADDQGVDSAQFEAPEHDDSGPHNGNGHPPEDEEGPVQDDEATAVDHGNDGVDYGDAVEDTENLVANDAFDYITNPDGELEGADDGNVTGDDGDGEYNIEIENIGDGSTLDHEITTAVEIGDSATKVTQEQAAYASANGGEPSVQTSATSTLNGEEIAYDETHESLDQAVASDPAPYGSNGLDSTLDEIDWDNADEGEAVESSAVSTTPHSASGKRLRQAEDGPESLADDGDNKRRRI